MRFDLDNVTKAQVLAVQTRAQMKRQEQQLQADAAATAASEAVIHSLDSAQPADGLGGGPPVDQDGGPTSPGSSRPVDRPGRESTPGVSSSAVSSAVATLVEDVTSGVEAETEDEEEREAPSVVITDPFTRQDLIDQQKADESLKPLFEAARLGDPEYFVRDDILYGKNLQPKPEETPHKIVVPTPMRNRVLQLGHNRSGHFGHKKTKNHNTGPLHLARH